MQEIVSRREGDAYDVIGFEQIIPEEKKRTRYIQPTIFGL
jgi:hypothetical protein